MSAASDPAPASSQATVELTEGMQIPDVNSPSAAADVENEGAPTPVCVAPKKKKVRKGRRTGKGKRSRDVPNMPTIQEENESGTLQSLRILRPSGDRCMVPP